MAGIDARRLRLSTPPHHRLEQLLLPLELATRPGRRAA